MPTRGKGRFKPCQFGANLANLNLVLDAPVVRALQQAVIVRRSGHNYLQVVDSNESFNSLF